MRRRGPWGGGRLMLHAWLGLAWFPPMQTDAPPSQRTRKKQKVCTPLGGVSAPTHARPQNLENGTPEGPLCSVPCLDILTSHLAQGLERAKPTQQWTAMPIAGCSRSSGRNCLSGYSRTRNFFLRGRRVPGGVVVDKERKRRLKEGYGPPLARQRFDIHALPIDTRRKILWPSCSGPDARLHNGNSVVTRS
ncbi:hypothetical protein VUR80DRAFT_1863 [Thermomyces stellatus]